MTGLSRERETELLRALNHARSCLRDAEDEATNGRTASMRYIDKRVTEARMAIDHALLLAYPSETDDAA